MKNRIILARNLKVIKRNTALIYRLLSISLLLILLSSCVGTKESMQNAEIFQKEGVPDKAYEEFKYVYQRRGNAEAYLGMKNSAEQMLASRALHVNMAILNADEAAFERISEYEDMIDAFKLDGLHLDHQLQIELWQTEATKALTDKYAQQAQNLLAEKDYEGARMAIRKLEAVNRNDERVNALWTISKVVEHYRLGKDYLNLGLKEQALEEFNEVVRRDADFADALALRDQIIEDLSFTIAYVTLDNSSVNDELENIAANRIQEAVLDLDKPFMHLVERDQLMIVLNEQQATMGAAFGEESVIEAGQLMGAEYILSGQFLKFDLDLYESPTESKFAYTGRNAAWSGRVKYEEREISWIQDVVFSWKLINAESGKVYRSGTIPVSDEGRRRVADYDGNYKELYPGEVKLGVLPTPWDKVHKDSKSRQEFRAMFDHEGLPELQKMKEDVFTLISSEVANALKDFNGQDQ